MCHTYVYHMVIKIMQNVHVLQRKCVRHVLLVLSVCHKFTWRDTRRGCELWFRYHRTKHNNNKKFAKNQSLDSPVEVSICTVNKILVGSVLFETPHIENFSPTETRINILPQTQLRQGRGSFLQSHGFLVWKSYKIILIF